MPGQNQPDEMNTSTHFGSEPSYQTYNRFGLIDIYVTKLQINSQASGAD